MTDKNVVPIEAVHDDGRVIALGELQEHGNHMWPEKAKSADGLIEFYISRSRNEICAGTMGDGWRIRNVAPNPLSLETSDLDPITPEEDAVATGVLAEMGMTRQAHDSVVRGLRRGRAKSFVDSTCEYCGGNGFSGGVITAEAEWDHACEVCHGTGKSPALGGAVVTLDVFLAAYQDQPDEKPLLAADDLLTFGHLRAILSAIRSSAHSIQSGGEGGEGA